MPYYADEPSIANVLQEIAIVNIQKLPARNGTKTDMRDIEAAYKSYWNEITAEQIRLLEPQIIICGGAYDITANYFGRDYKGECEDADYGVSKFNQLIIHAAHPAAIVGESKYVDGIIGAAEAGLPFLQ